MAQNRKPGNEGTIISPSSIPPLLRPSDVKEFAKAASNPELVRRANGVIAAKSSEIAHAVTGYVFKLEAAARAGEMEALYDEAHEIRGLAETAGLVAAGRIANGLCRYLDEMKRIGVAPDPSLVTVHVEAIARATRATDEATKLGAAVTAELAKVTAHKISVAKENVKV